LDEAYRQVARRFADNKVISISWPNFRAFLCPESGEIKVLMALGDSDVCIRTYP